MPHDSNLVIDQVLPYREMALDRLCQWLGNRAFEADDILQDVLFRMLAQKRRRLRHPDRYLLRACANGVKEHFRKSSRWTTRIQLYGIVRRATASECELGQLADDPRLSGFSRGKLRVAWLVAAGFSLVEAAEYLGISPGAARTRLYEARKFFKGVA